MSEADEPHGLPGIARWVTASPPSCGPVRLVAVDGHAGSGKSTLAGRLAPLLGDAPVLHLDDVAAHGEFFDWTDRLAEQVLTPLGHGSPARFDVYDWQRCTFTRTDVLPPAPVVLVEGVGAGRRRAAPAPGGPAVDGPGRGGVLGPRQAPGRAGTRRILAGVDTGGGGALRARPITPVRGLPGAGGPVRLPGARPAHRPRPPRRAPAPVTFREGADAMPHRTAQGVQAVAHRLLTSAPAAITFSGTRSSRPHTDTKPPVVPP